MSFKHACFLERTLNGSISFTFIIMLWSNTSLPRCFLPTNGQWRRIPFNFGLPRQQETSKSKRCNELLVKEGEQNEAQWFMRYLTVYSRMIVMMDFGLHSRWTEEAIHQERKIKLTKGENFPDAFELVRTCLIFFFFWLQNVFEWTWVGKVIQILICNKRLNSNVFEHVRKHWNAFEWNLTKNG